jgi:hypothetical protein
VGAVPELWHEVQVEPFIPEYPEIPLLLAWAAGDNMIERTINTNENRVTQRPLVFPGLD